MPEENVTCSTDEYPANVYIRQPHSADRPQIEGHALGACKQDAIARINHWNDSPEGEKYELDHVEFLRMENETYHSDYDPWTGVRHWELKGTAKYKLCYKKST